MHSNITTPLIVGDTIYGIGSHGHVRGLRADTGERIWEAEGLTARNRWGSAHFVQREDRYFVYNETGELIIARFTPEGYVELDRTHLLNPTSRTGYGPTRAGSRARRRHGQSDRLVVWSHPAFANRHVVLRNDEEIIRVSLDEAAESRACAGPLRARRGARRAEWRRTTTRSRDRPDLHDRPAAAVSFRPATSDPEARAGDHAVVGLCFLGIRAAAVRFPSAWRDDSAAWVG